MTNRGNIVGQWVIAVVLMAFSTFAGDLDHLIYADDVMMTHRAEAARLAEDPEERAEAYAEYLQYGQYAKAEITDIITVEQKEDGSFTVMMDAEKLKDALVKSSEDDDDDGKDGNFVTDHPWMSGAGLAAILRIGYHNRTKFFGIDKESPSAVQTTTTTITEQGDADEAAISIGGDINAPVTITVIKGSPEADVTGKQATGSGDVDSDQNSGSSSSP